MTVLPPCVFHDAPHAPPFARLHDVDVLTGITPDPMDGPMDGRAPSGQTLPIQRDDTEHAAVMFRDINDIFVVHVKERGSDQFGWPDRDQLAVEIENLHAVVLTVRHQQASSAVVPDAVWQVELSGLRSRLTPGEHVLAGGRELVHTRVAVTVGDVNFATGYDDDIRG